MPTLEYVVRLQDVLWEARALMGLCDRYYLADGSLFTITRARRRST